MLNSLDSFSSPIEELKSAASYALSYLSLGNLQKYIPFILNEIDTNLATFFENDVVWANLILNGLEDIQTK
jgi:hypothetical protein